MVRLLHDPGQLVVGRNLVGRAAEGDLRCAPELRILSTQAIKNRLDFITRNAWRFTGNGAALHLQVAAIGIAAQFVPAGND